MAVDWAAIRNDFPVLRREIDGAPLVYLDSGNTSQKPVQVIEAMDQFLRTGYAPINRSAYRLAGEATDRFEGARTAVARLVNAPRADEIVFTKNATEALNLVASSWGGTNLREGDVVVLTHMEHHANIVPWQMLAAHTGCEIRWIPLTDDGQLDLTDLDRLLDGAKALSFTAMSNVLGTVNDGYALLEPVLDGARAGLAAEMLGNGLEAFERTLAYLKLREQFDQKIGAFQALKHRAALMFCELELTRSAVVAALTAIDEGRADVPALASLAKAKACDALELVSNEAIQMHGGIGMTDAEEIGFFLKRARVAQQILGDASFHRDRYATLMGF